MTDAHIPLASGSSGRDKGEPVKSLAEIYQVMDNLSPAVFAGLATVDGKVIYANRSALDAIGATIEEIKGQSVESTPLLAHSDAARQKWHEALAAAANGVPARFEFSYEPVGNGLRTEMGRFAAFVLGFWITVPFASEVELTDKYRRHRYP